MNRNVWSARLYKLATILVVVGMLFTGVTATALAADEPASDDGSGAQAAAANFSVGNGEREVAAYWQDYYDSGEGDLPNAQGNVTGFYNTLRYHGWEIFGLPRWCNFSGHDCYIWSNSAVWEDDFVDNNNSYIDSVDLVFYEGHGWPGGFTVRPPDDYYVQHGEVQNAWGNSDLEYLMLLSCSVLADSSKASWYGAFNGLHLMAGFANTAYDVGGFGNKLATDIVWGYSYKDAWFRACDTHQPSGVTARVLAEEYANYSESAYYSPYDFGVDPPKNGYYWWWDKACGAPTTSSLQPNQLGDQFPIFNTPPLSLDEANRTFNNLTDAFAFNAEVGAASATVDIGNTRVMTDAEGRTLEMENSTGQFYYFDPARTFSPTVGLSAAQMLSPEDAKDIADQFLTQNGLMPADAKYNTTKPVELTEEQVGGVAAARVFTTSLTTYEVIYSRYLTTSVTTVDAASGEARTEVVEIPVDGPGAKVKVYVSPSGGGVAAANAVQTGAVVGAQGGWRKAEASVNAAGVQDTVTILPFDPVIKALFADNFLESHVAFTKVPFSNPTKKEILSQNLSTYEESTTASSGQANLYPAYRLLARYEGVPANNPQAVSGLNETVVFTDYTWIPANETFMRPLAKIKSNSDVSQPLKPGDTVTVEAWDASTKLKDAGFDASLDFMMGSGPFTYQWYLNEVNDANKIGAANSKTLSFQVPATSEGSKEGLTTFKLIVLVTDTGNSNTALNSAQATLDVTAITPNYLPIVTKPQ
jgi:hypothetical protein